MGLVSTVGLGSGLNIQSLVTQLVSAERLPADTALTKREARAQAQLTSLGTVKGAFSQLQTALNALKADGLFDGRSITSSDNGKLTAKAHGDTAAATGSFDIEIESIATVQKLRSDATLVPTADTELGTGTLTFTIGDDSFDIVVDSSNNTLTGLAEAINTASSDVSAAVVRGDDGYSLTLTATNAGSAGAFSIAQTAGGSTLADFTYDPDAPADGLDVVTAATDAVIYVDGVKRTSGSNTVTDAIAGVELILVKPTEAGDTIKVGITADTSGARKAIESFVSAYNGAVSAIRNVSAYNPDTGVAAPLNGDALIRGAGSRLRSELGDALTAIATSGIDFGLKTDLDGKLSFDATKFAEASANSPVGLRSLLAGESGVLYANLSGYVDGLLETDNGGFALRTATLEGTIESVSTDREALDRRMQSFEDRVRRQFIALDGLIGKLNSTGQYLSQQLASLPTAGSSG